MATSPFAAALVGNRHRATVEDLLETFLEWGYRWDTLDDALQEALHRFDAHLFTAAYARQHVENDERIERLQDFLIRTAVTSFLDSLDRFDGRLQKLVEERGAATLFHHVQRELVDTGADRDGVFEAAGACRMTAFGLEDLLKDTAEEEMPVEELVLRRDALVTRLLDLIDPDSMGFDAGGLALLWMASAVGLGGLDDASDTVTFARDD
jgi:hypothetical protein